MCHIPVKNNTVVWVWCADCTAAWLEFNPSHKGQNFTAEKGHKNAKEACYCTQFAKNAQSWWKILLSYFSLEFGFSVNSDNLQIRWWIQGLFCFRHCDIICQFDLHGFHKNWVWRMEVLSWMSARSWVPKPQRFLLRKQNLHKNWA